MFKSKNETNVVYKCTTQLLEDADVLECEFHPNHKGSFLLSFVCEQLEIVERDYFGLRFVDKNTKQRHWLDLAKNIIKQVKDVDPVVFSLRVKFYPADPLRLTGNGKLMTYQQIKRDLIHGRLYCSAGEAAALGALIVQEELGDFDPEIHLGDYVSGIRFSLRQSEVLERKVMELHQRREPNLELKTIYDEFLTIAKGLETYGVDPHPVKDHRGTQLYLGINYSGISTFAAGRRAQHIRWPEVNKLNYEGKMFIAHLSYTDASREPKKHTVGFKCPTGSACRYVWRCAIEQMLFFTLPNSQNASVMSGGGFFNTTKFRYSGRTEREILSEGINALREQKLANSSPSKRKANSVPATPSSPQGDLAEIRYSSLPRSTMSEPMGCSDHIPSYGPDTGLPLLETVSEEARHKADPNHDFMSDYYFRDSFEHSSSESGFNLTDTRIGHRKVLNNGMESGSQQKPAFIKMSNHQSATALAQQQNASNSAKSARRFSLIHVFVPSFIFVVIFLCLSAVFIIESESEVFVTLKNWPEMVCLRYQYYEPMKQYFVEHFWKEP